MTNVGWVFRFDLFNLLNLKMRLGLAMSFEVHLHLRGRGGDGPLVGLGDI